MKFPSYYVKLVLAVNFTQVGVLQMKTAFDVLNERGFIEQTTHIEEVKELLAKEKVTFYVGFDPTADSLTVGHFIPVMAMAHMQRAGHRPIAIVGGGTGMVGDPSHRNELRRVMTPDEIQHNVDSQRKQLEKFIDFEDEKALMVNNADWLLKLEYVSFLREYGTHFSVNRMLTAECYKSRMEKGLSFFEFNYMIMQAYDFLELYRRYNCKIQMGGNDQWSNIIAGSELIRRVDNGSAYGMTFKLLTKSDGQKMGKSEKGAVWLDPNKTPPYEFFQYWRNVADDDVEKCLKLLTFLPIEEISELCKEGGSTLNKAKEVLAYELTKIVHNSEDADKALAAAKSLFSGDKSGDSVPIIKVDFKENVNIIELLVAAKIVPSKSEGRRLIEQGGLRINENKIDDINTEIVQADFVNGFLMIQKGKKHFYKLECS